MKVSLLLRSRRDRPDGAAGKPTLGHCEEAAMAAAVAMARAHGGELIVVAAGPPESEEPILRQLLAAGAKRALRVWDPALAAVDYHGVARVLAAAVKRYGFDLVLAGDRSDDEAQGAVGPAVAEALGVPHLTAALDLRIEDGAAHVTRRDAGAVRTLKLPLPAAVAISCFPPRDAAAAGPPAADLRGESPRGGGKTPEIEVFDLAALGIRAPELRHRDRCLGRAVPVRVSRNATIVDDADELVSRLRADRLL